MRSKESLLDARVRAELGLARQLAMYLDPFALFMDASRGSLLERSRAAAYNREMRWMLLPYLRRWLAIAAAMLAAAAVAEVATDAARLSVAAAGVGFAVAFTVALWTGAVYLLLGVRVDAGRNP